MSLSRVVRTVSYSAGRTFISGLYSDIILIVREDHVILFVDSYPYSTHGSISLLNAPVNVSWRYGFSHGSILGITVLVTVRGSQSVQHQTTGEYRTP